MHAVPWHPVAGILHNYMRWLKYCVNWPSCTLSHNLTGKQLVQLSLPLPIPRKPLVADFPESCSFIQPFTRTCNQLWWAFDSSLWAQSPAAVHGLWAQITKDIALVATLMSLLEEEELPQVPRVGRTASFLKFHNYIWNLKSKLPKI